MYFFRVQHVNATVEYFAIRHLEHAGKLFVTSVLVYKPLSCLLPAYVYEHNANVGCGY